MPEHIVDAPVAEIGLRDTAVGEEAVACGQWHELTQMSRNLVAGLLGLDDGRTVVAHAVSHHGLRARLDRGQELLDRHLQQGRQVNQLARPGHRFAREPVGGGLLGHPARIAYVLAREAQARMVFLMGWTLSMGSVFTFGRVFGQVWSS